MTEVILAIAVWCGDVNAHVWLSPSNSPPTLCRQRLMKCVGHNLYAVHSTFRDCIEQEMKGKLK